MVIYTLTTINNEILNILSKGYTLKRIDMDHLSQAYMDKNTYALAINCDSSNCLGIETKKIVNLFLDNNKSVILLNSNEEQMTYLVGLGLDCNNAVVQKYIGNQIIINCVDDIVPQTEVSAGRESTNVKTGQVESEEISPKPNLRLSATSNSNGNNSMQKAMDISSIIKSPATTGLNINQTANLTENNVDLPSGIAKTFYVKLAKKNKLDPDIPQEYNNELVFVVELIASYKNPPYKYMSITTLGNGLNPTNGMGLYYNNNYNRGYWQDHIEIKMYPMSSELTQLTNEPKNINNVTDYKVETTLKFDVDISKNPAFKPSYTQTNTYATTILDFDIVNKSIPEVAAWDFQMSATKDDIYDIFEDVLFDQPHVRPLPILATQNMQPYCASVWYTDNTFNGKASVRLTNIIEYYDANTTTAPFMYYKNYKRVYYAPQVTFTADFSEVNP